MNTYLLYMKRAFGSPAKSAKNAKADLEAPFTVILNIHMGESPMLATATTET